MKFAFAGYDFFVNVAQTLIEGGWSLSHVYLMNVDGVYNSNETLKSLAAESGAELRTERIGRSDILDLERHGVNVLISGGYGYWIPSDVGTSMHIINVHPTLLPFGRGPWPLPYLINEEPKSAGVTLHLVNQKFDAGNILLQEKIDVGDRDNLESVSFKARYVAGILARQLTENFDDLIAHSIPQIGEGSYWPMPEWADRTIDFHSSVDRIDRLVRSYGSFDTGASFDGKDWIVQDVSVWKIAHSFQPGFVVLRSHREVMIAASDGMVILRRYRIDPDWKEAL